MVTRDPFMWLYVLFNYAVAMLVPLTVLVAWAALGLIALLHLRRSRLDEQTRVLWVLVVVLVPVAGAVASLIVRPGEPRPSGERSGS